MAGVCCVTGVVSRQRDIYGPLWGYLDKGTEMGGFCSMKAVCLDISVLEQDRI
jgi:hypothetical protein